MSLSSDELRRLINAHQSALLRAGQTAYYNGWTPGTVNKNSMDKMLKHVLSHISDVIEDEKGEKVIRTVPIKKSWEPKLKAFEEEIEKTRKMEDELEEQFYKLNSKKRAFWVEVEEDLGEYGPMALNVKDGEVEILEK